MTRFDYLTKIVLSFFEINSHMSKQEFYSLYEQSLDLSFSELQISSENLDKIMLQKENEMLKNNLKLLTNEFARKNKYIEG